MEIIISLIISILLTGIFYLAFPLFLIIRKTRMNEKKARKIAIWNSIIVFIVFTIIHILTDGKTANPTAALTWFFIVQAILNKFCPYDSSFWYSKQQVPPQSTVETEVISTSTEVETTSSQPIHYTSTTPLNTYYKKSKGPIIAIIILSILMVGLGGLNVVQFLTIVANEEEIGKLFVEAENWETEYDYIVSDYSQLLDDYDNLVDKYNTLVDKYNSLLDEYNSVVKEKEEYDAFETLTFSGKGSSTIKGINIPAGNYYITCKYKGDRSFYVKFYKSVTAASYDYIDAASEYQTSETTKGFSGPINNGYINIDTSAGSWTITMEKAE